MCKIKERGIGKMQSFIIVQVDYKYCEYLRTFDERVPYNSGIKRNRPFIGVLFKVDGLEYFTPLSSPKEKHKHMRNTIDFIKIADGELGAINFNNMIPIRTKCYEELNLLVKPKTTKEIQYYHMLQMQLIWLNKNYHRVIKKAKNLYTKHKNNQLNENIYKRCCNFSLLEQKCQEYDSTLVSSH